MDLRTICLSALTSESFRSSSIVPLYDDCDLNLHESDQLITYASGCFLSNECVPRKPNPHVSVVPGNVRAISPCSIQQNRYGVTPAPMLCRHRSATIILCTIDSAPPGVKLYLAGTLLTGRRQDAVLDNLPRTSPDGPERLQGKLLRVLFPTKSVYCPGSP